MKNLQKKFARKIAAQLNSENLEGLEVEVSSNNLGTLITLSDQSKSGMFTVGSARPTPELVNVMSKIGTVISENNGTVSINGHTDGRQYQSAEYDNWRLSTARAHMAYYMLVRGGMPEKRLESIVGHADMKLKTPTDPLASSNRRIEILLRM